ncbi:hypothetical protein QS257_03325 [Terrilactibacillus sp. S3-3]|nr:hypothetical protein QS257_03325 [Terrilactibacillus sp. S3-3]
MIFELAGGEGRMKKWWVIGIVIVVIIGGGAAWFFLKSKPKQSQVIIPTAVVQKGTIESKVNGSGKLVPERMKI